MSPKKVLAVKVSIRRFITQTELHAMILPELTLRGLPGSSAASTCSLCQAGTYGTGSGRPPLHVTGWSRSGQCDVV